MEIVVTGRNVRVPQDVRAAVEQKIGSLDRFVNGLDHADVVFKEEHNPRIAEREHLEVTLQGHGHHIRCKVNGVDQHTAIDLAVGKLEKQLRKLKTKVVKRHRPNLHRDENHHPLQKAINGLEPAGDVLVEDLDEDVEPPPSDLAEPRIVRTKSFELVPMTAANAVDRMQLLDHDFFLFCNADTGRPSVVYIRDDGDIGLIEAAETEEV